MGTEIERKFLVTGDGWRDTSSIHTCRQCYLALGPPAAVRVRIMDDKATLNIKRADKTLITRDEFEYEIPPADAQTMMNSLGTGRLIEKTRYKVEHKGLVWEVDEFHGANEGLLVAEVELEHEDQPFEKPPWAGEEVSNDPRYLNVNLARRPYKDW